MTKASWKDVLPSPPAGGQLREAWMTSFERPEASLLVEHLLPSLLRARHSLSQEHAERALFFGELSTALEALRDRLTVISSPARAASEDSHYPWLWRYVSHFIVGKRSRAVQHAKLWAFHWGVGQEDYLELHVSSTNLTTAAFRNQLQAGWHVLLRLEERSSQIVQRTWGELLPFLSALGASAGELATARLERLKALLGRVERPATVTFVASVPGRRGSARQLRRLEPTELHVLTPTVGAWSEKRVAAWSADVGVVPGRVHLKWIAATHPWAAYWSLSRSSSEGLQESGVTLECLPKETRFVEDHQEADRRWCHAKLYLLRSRRKRRLLVTSANWSVAAWGAGREPPRNFELGVVFESEWTGLEALGDSFAPPDIVPFCVEDAEDEERMSALEWAEASWDGEHIQLCARSAERDVPIEAVVTFTGGGEERVALGDSQAILSWTDAVHTPLRARFTQGTEALHVDVIDARPPAAFAQTPLPEVDPALQSALREAFLLQRYGGPAVDSESIPGVGEAHGPPGIGAPPAEYSVRAWLDARAGFQVVDNWCAALDSAQTDPAELDRVRLDGRTLRSVYAHRGGPADVLVAEELGWRLGDPDDG